MPSIPAIQQNIVKEDIKNKILSELSEDIAFKDIPEIKKLEQIKHNLLYTLVWWIMVFRGIRFEILAEISYEEISGDWGSHVTIKRPILFIRCMILAITTLGFGAFWQILSDTFGWNWNLRDDLPFA